MCVCVCVCVCVCIFGYVLMRIEDDVEKYTRLFALVTVQGSGEKENKTLTKGKKVIME